MVKLLLLMYEKNGLVIDDILTQFKVARATAMRDIKALREAGLVEFAGTPKTGKYMLTKLLKKRIS